MRHDFGIFMVLFGHVSLFLGSTSCLSCTCVTVILFYDVGAIVLVNVMYYMVSEQCLFCILCNILTFTILHLFVVEKQAPFVNKKMHKYHTQTHIKLVTNIHLHLVCFFHERSNIEECVNRTRIPPPQIKIKMRMSYES